MQSTMQSLPPPPPKPIAIKFTDGTFDMPTHQFHPTTHTKNASTLGYSYKCVDIPPHEINDLKQHVLQFLELILPNHQQRHSLLHALSKALIQDGSMVRYIWAGRATASKDLLKNIIGFTFGKYCTTIHHASLEHNTKDITKSLSFQQKQLVTMPRLVFTYEATQDIKIVPDKLRQIMGTLIIPTTYSIEFEKSHMVAFSKISFDVQLSQETTPTINQQSDMGVGLFYLLKDYCCGQVDSSIRDNVMTSAMASINFANVARGNESIDLDNVKNSIEAFVNTKCKVDRVCKILWSHLVGYYESFCIDTNMKLQKAKTIKDELATFGVTIKSQHGYVWCIGIDVLRE